MLAHYLLVASRRIRRDVRFVLVNVLGLAAGLAATLVLFEVVAHETSYDRGPGSDRTYRIAYETTFGGVSQSYARGPSALLAALETSFPAVEAAAALVSYDDVLVERTGTDAELGTAYYATPAVFDVLPRRFASGSPATALAEPGSMVLTETAANRLFGHSNVVGQDVTLSDGETYTVSAVLESGALSHLDYDALVAAPPNLLRVWNGFVALTYARLAPGTNPEAFEQRVADHVKTHAAGEWGDILAPFLQDVRTIHLESHLEAEAGRNGSKRSVWVLTLAAGLTLLMSVSNYVNLASLRASKRIGEVGVRRAVGATRPQVMAQLLVEAGALAVLAVPPALVLYAVLRQVIAPETAGWARTGATPLIVFGGAVLASLVVGAIAGAYPAWVLSRVGPASALRGGARLSGAAVRRSLMGLQFAVTLAFVLTAVVVTAQMRYVASKDLGYEPDGVLYARIWAPLSPSEFESFSRDVRELRGVRMASYGELPGVQSGGYFAEGPTGQSLLVHRYRVGPHYAEVMGIDMAAGEPIGETDGLMVNEVAARHLGLSDPVGEILIADGQSLPVLGVMRDFHFFSLHEPIPPVYAYAPQSAGPYLLVRTYPGRSSGLAGRIASLWERRGTGAPLVVRDLSTRLGDEYREEVRLGLLLSTFSLLAVGIAFLGLFTLVSYVIARRRKELSVRRVLGAPVAALVWLIGSESVVVFAVAAAVATATAVVLGRIWLEGFTYRASLPSLAFALTLSAVLALTVLLSLYHVLREAKESPVVALREP